MSRKAKFTPEEKEQAVIDYLEGNKSRTQICGELCISSRTIQDWALIYNKHGLAGFSKKMRNGSYSKEFKMKVVEEYVRGDGSSIDLGIKYDISYGLLRKWIRMYNANRELKDYNPKQEVYMAEARRKTTLEERKEIVDYCINHNRNYKNTAAKFDVSYRQVYSWVKKYDQWIARKADSYICNTVDAWEHFPAALYYSRYDDRRQGDRCGSTGSSGSC